MIADPLELETRRRLYRHIVEHPGKYLRELQRDMDMAMGALEHHLRELQQGGLVMLLHDANKRYFPAELPASERRILAFLRQGLARRALVLVLAQGTCTKAQLLAALDVPASTLNYHLAHLVRAGLLHAGREGRDATYAVTDPETITRLLIAHRASLLDRLVDSFLDGIDAMR